MQSFTEWRSGTAEERTLLAQCREAVQVLLPNAEVILHGSRARGDARQDSDYDLLVFVDGEVDWQLEDQIRQCLYPLELATGAVLTVYAYSRQTWDSPPVSGYAIHPARRTGWRCLMTPEARIETRR